MPLFHKFIYHKIMRPLRLKAEARIVNRLKGATILEIGYFDDKFKRLLRKDFVYTGVDPDPIKYIQGMPKKSIEDFNPKEKFDIVVASNILEHVPDPVKAIKKIKKLAKRYIFISVPYEPFYTISRFFVPEEEHFWTVHPNVLEHYFGKPIYQKFIHLKRTYMAIYAVNK